MFGGPAAILSGGDQAHGRPEVVRVPARQAEGDSRVRVEGVGADRHRARRSDRRDLGPGRQDAGGHDRLVEIVGGEVGGGRRERGRGVGHAVGELTDHRGGGERVQRGRGYQPDTSTLGHEAGDGVEGRHGGLPDVELRVVRLDRGRQSTGRHQGVGVGDGDTTSADRLGLERPGVDAHGTVPDDLPDLGLHLPLVGDAPEVTGLVPCRVGHRQCGDDDLLVLYSVGGAAEELVAGDVDADDVVHPGQLRTARISGHVARADQTPATCPGCFDRLRRRRYGRRPEGSEIPSSHPRGDGRRGGGLSGLGDGRGGGGDPGRHRGGDVLGREARSGGRRIGGRVSGIAGGCG